MASSIQMSGLASGMDTSTIVEQLMSIERQPLDRLNKDKQLLEWKQEDYRTINTALRSFRDSVFNMKLQSTFLAKSATSSNESVLTATAGSSATAGTYSVTVTKLAEAVSKASTGELNDEAGKTLSEQLGVSGTITFTLEGSKGSKDFSFDASTDTINNVVQEINNADLGITASYDADMNRFFMATTSTGEAAKINVTSDPGNFLSDAGGTGTNTLKLKLVTGENKGQDALYDFGDATGLSSSNNTVTVNGITLNLKANGTSTITVTKDTDNVFDAIVQFVDSYNTVMETISDELYEKRYSDYLPLTDEEKEELSETQIEKWENLARSGLLRNDPIMSSIYSDMRITMSSKVPGLAGKYKSLASIGITTTKYHNDPSLVVDEDQLREALEEDPEGVMKLFTTSPDDYKSKGVAARLYEDVEKGMERLIDQAGSATSNTTADNSNIGKKLTDIDNRIETLEDRLALIEDRYWSKFTAMETALSKLNSQSSWLTQQFSSL